MTANAHPAQPARARGGLMPFYIAAVLGFAFTLSFAGKSDPAAARVTLAFGAAAFAVTIVLVGQVVLALRGRKRFPFLEELPTHEALEENKKRLLSALKEIEFDHEMNKINDRDYADLKARYEAEALKVLKALDDERVRWHERAEEVARTHLKKAGLKAAGGKTPAKGGKAGGAGKKASPPETKPASAATTEMQAAEAATGPVCAECGTANDPDARFCKQCGAEAEAAERPCPDCGTSNDADARFCKRCGSGLEVQSA